MNLGKLLEETYIACGLQVLRRVATGGTATTVVDSGIVNKKSDGYYAQGANGGHILFISQSTDGLSPQGKFGEVSAFTLSTTTPTFTIPTVTDAVAAGDIYAVMKPIIQLYEMIGRVNEGLRRLGEQDRPNTTLTGLADTLVYSLPAGINVTNIKKIEIGNNTDGWCDAPGYTIQPQQGGTVDQLMFTHQPPYDSTTPANQTIKITYHGPHPTLSIYSDYVEKSVPDELAIAICAEVAWELLMRKKTTFFSDRTKQAMFNDIQKQSAKAQAEHPIRTKPADLPKRINFAEM